MIDKLFLKLFWHFLWAGTLFHHGKSGQQKLAEQQSANSIAQQQADQSQMNNLTNAANRTLNTAQGSLGQFEGPVQQSPFYKALLTSGIESTSNAYDQARANTAQRAQMAGFGYSQPITQGADNQLAAREAETQASLPREAMLETAPLTMRAAEDTIGIGRDKAGMGQAYGQQGLQYGQQADNYNQQAYGMNKQRGSIWNDLLKVGQIGAGVASNFLVPGSGWLKSAVMAPVSGGGQVG